MAFLKYSLIRLALFVPLFVLFYVLQLGAIVSVICAGLMAFGISFLFFQKQRDEAVAAVHHRLSGRAKPIRSANEVEDANAEDALVDSNPDIKVRLDGRRKDG